MTPMLLLDGHGSRFESSLNTSKKATTNGPSALVYLMGLLGWKQGIVLNRMTRSKFPGRRERYGSKGNALLGVLNQTA